VVTGIVPDDRQFGFGKAQPQVEQKVGRGGSPPKVVLMCYARDAL
jgi:hypothetical protein